MSVALYTDVHVPLPIVKGLRQRGVTVLRSQEDGTAEFEDSALLDRATNLGYVVLTQDEDFLVEAALRQASEQFFAGVIFVPQQTLSVRQCIEELELIANVYEPEDLANRVEYLPLK